MSPKPPTGYPTNTYYSAETRAQIEWLQRHLDNATWSTVIRLAVKTLYEKMKEGEK